MNTSITHVKNAIIVSDLHLGSRYFVCRHFERFLCSIPEDHELVLNGDVIDNPHTKLPPPHLQVLDLIEQISRRQRVVWIRGNHDNGYTPAGFEKVDFRRIYNLERKLLIVHGDDFDEIMPRNQAFLKVFVLMHNLRVKLGARPVHVANYAKKWKTFYKYLRKNIMTNASNCALENGYEAVTCGHSHYPEYRVCNGIRYINTGAWTEFPTFYLQITAGEMFLNPFVDKSDSKKLTGFSRGRQVLKPPGERQIRSRGSTN
ncbi:UDP-2,3-diacylglucosamine diphosphatase [Thermodesulfobacteriota bacterium]